MSESQKTGAQQQGSLIPILAVNFVGTLGFSIVLPFLVFLVTKWGGNALIYGLIGATYSVFQLVGAPILGRWSDRYGRRKILLLSQMGTLLSWVIFLTAFFLPATAISGVNSTLLGQFTLTIPLIILFIARAADGITGGNVSVANAYLADITDDEKRSENFGRMAISGNLGYVLGPALAGVLGATIYGEILPVIAALIISLIATLIIAFGLKESNPCTLKTDPERGSVRKVFGQEQKNCFPIAGADETSFRDVLQVRRVPTLLLIYFLVTLGFSFYYIAFPIHAVSILQWSMTSIGTYFAVLSLAMVVVQGPVLKWAAMRISDPVLLISGSLVLAIGFAMLLSESVTMIYTSAALIALGNGLMWPSVMAILSRVAGDRYQGAVQGFAGSAGAVASIVGLIVGGLLYNWIGAQVYVIAAATILAVAAIGVLIRDS